MSSEEEKENRCCLCLESQDNKIRITLVCGHTMDYNCFLNLRRALCPLCRKEIDTPTQFIPPEFVFQPSSDDFIPPPPPPAPSLQRQHAHDIFIDLDTLFESQPRHAFPSQWFSPNRFELEIPISSGRQRRHQQRRQRQREARRRYRSFRPNEDEIDFIME